MKTSQATLLRGAVQAFVREFGLLATNEAPCGQSMPTSEAHALVLLLEAEQADIALSAKELVQRLNIDKSNVSRLCRRFESSGLITCRASEEDGRVKLIKLTAKGRRKATKVDTAGREKFAAIAKELTGSSSASVISALEQLTAVIRELPRDDG